MTHVSHTMLDWALRYASLGWHVVPLHHPTPAGCSCGQRSCSSPGKHPRTRHGVADATTDEERIRTWWQMWPAANIGIACGPSGLVVLDIDPRHGGDESLLDLIERHGTEVRDTCCAQTGGGGTHLVYRLPAGASIGNVASSERFVGPLGPGIDVRAIGGYIVAPPSAHASGALYEWYADEDPWSRPPAELPAGLRELLEVRDHRASDLRVPSLQQLLEQGVDEGARNDTLFRVAAKLRYLDLPLDTTLHIIGDIAARCRPPLPLREVEQVVRSAYRYEPGGVAVVARQPVDGPAPGAQADGEPGGEDLFPGRRLLGPIIKQPDQPVDWVVEPVLVAGRVHLVYGEPESGKTILALSWMLQLIQQGHHVMFVDEESGEQSVAQLLRAMGADSRIVDERLHYFPFTSVGDPMELERMKAYARAINARAVFVDSLTDMLASAGVDENAGTEVTGWMLNVAQAMAREEYAPAVVLVDHIAKDADNRRYAVGSRAKKAKSDVLWYVEKLLRFDRQTVGRVALHRHKNRPGVLPHQVLFTVGGEDGRLICRPLDPVVDQLDQHPLEADILAALAEEPMSSVRLAEELGAAQRTVSRVLARLSQRGLVRMDGGGRASRWVLVRQGSDMARNLAGEIFFSPGEIAEDGG